jgi:succinate-semialdehyde dehydrogenase/glutarate-semialdehyde dehydrogenase
VILNNPQLFRQQAYIDGEWTAGDSAAIISVVNPSSNVSIGQVPRMGKVETRRAIAAAERALPAWRELSAKERATRLRRWYDLIIENRQDLAHIMTLEQGKPLPEALGEITFGASYIEWYAEEAKRVYGDVIAGATDKRLLVIKQPVGVCAAITPWNFPSAMITRKAGPALAAGCTMVIKPASQTPFSALALVYLAELAGIPKGVRRGSGNCRGTDQQPGGAQDFFYRLYRNRSPDHGKVRP